MISELSKSVTDLNNARKKLQKQGKIARYALMNSNTFQYLLESDVFALTWDIGHSNSVQNMDEPFILCYENKLKHFHIHDSLGRKDHMMLGTGEIDLSQRLSIAGKLQCRCVVETKTIEALRESVDWLSRNSIF